MPSPKILKEMVIRYATTAIIAKHQRVMKSISTAAFWFLVQDRMSIALLRFPFGWYSSGMQRVSAQFDVEKVNQQLKSI